MPKISGLPPMNSPADDDVLAIDDDSVADPTSPDKTKKISLSTLKTWLQSLAGWVATAMLADKAVTPAKTATFNYQTDNANTIASVTDGAIKIQAGWGQVIGNSAANLTQTVAFPEAFTTVLGVSISFLDAKSSAAADITELTLQLFTGGGGTISAGDVTNTNFLAQLSRDSGVFSSSVYYGYSWIAWGIV